MVLELIVLGAIALTVILVLISNNSRSSVSRTTSTSNQTGSQIQDTSERIEEINRRAESSNSSRQSPNPTELENVISSMEKPLVALQASVKSTENDVQKVVRKAKRFRELKKQEADQLRSLINRGEEGELAKLEYNLDQLTGREDILQDQLDSTIKETVNLAEDIEIKIEEIEDKQQSYMSLLSEEEKKLLNDLKQNKEALEDIHHCLSIISQSENAQTKISQLVGTAQEEHQLEVTEKEIAEIEEALEELLHEETAILEELEELEQIEAETYQISERELNEIKEMLKEDNRIEHKLNEAKKGDGDFHNHLSEDQIRKIRGVLDELAKVLQNLGVEIEKEEVEEEEIEEEAEGAEEEIEPEIASDLDSSTTSTNPNKSATANRGEPNLQNLRARINQIESGNYKNTDRVLRACYELLDNYQDYSNDIYHGTWGRSIDNILEKGIKSEKGPQMTGETGVGSYVSFTYLPAVAFHYSLRSQPNTVYLIEKFLERNYGFNPDSNRSIRSEIIAFIDYMKDNKGKFAERFEQKREIVENNLKEISEIINSTNGFSDLEYKIKSFNVLEAIIGADTADVHFKGSIPTRRAWDEIEAYKQDKTLGEVKVDNINSQNLVAYIPSSFVEEYREKYSQYGIRVKNLDSLLIKHELRMRERYESEFILDYSDFWEGYRLGIVPRKVDYVYKPAKIQVSH